MGEVLLGKNEVMDRLLKECLEPEHAAVLIPDITPCSLGCDRKDPVVMYYFSAGSFFVGKHIHPVYVPLVQSRSYWLANKTQGYDLIMEIHS